MKVERMEQTILAAQAPRATLLKLLDSLLERRIIYIHAPAGFGKTVSSLLWLEHREALSHIKRAWVSLDEYDNKTAEFCGRFVYALTGLQPENAVLRELVTNPSFSTAPVEFTLRALSAFSDEPDNSILVLDDLHVINNNEILKFLPILFKRLPDNCKVLLLSRMTPPDSFSEMVTKEELAVVDAGHLQFTGEEVKLFFSKNGQYLSTQQADEIVAATGGWAIGIRALMLSQNKSYNIDLTDRYLDNFLKTHVWERWNDQHRSFMMLVSVAEELTPELCEWLVADEKALRKLPGTELLAGLVRENAFLRATGNNTYRFHDLFRKFLIHMLEERGERTIKKQWNKAGDYFYGKEDYFRAVAYYVKSGNSDGIAESLYSMYDYSSSYASIEDTLFCIHSSITDSVVKKYPFLLEVQAWAAFVEGRADDFEKYLDKYYKQFPQIVLQRPRSVIVLALLRCADYRKSLIHMTKTLHKIPLIGNIRAFTPSTSQNMPFFHKSFRDFSEYAFDTEKNIDLFEKTIGFIAGEEFDVIKECIYAGLLYEKGDLEVAHEHALAACTDIPAGCSAEIRFCAMMILASVLFADDQNTDANKIISNAKEMIESRNALYLLGNLRAYLFRYKLSEGDKDSAKEWLKIYDGKFLDDLMFFELYKHFTTARAYIVMGNYANAVLFLKKLLGLSERYKRTLDIMEARILLAIAYWKKGKGGQSIALDYLEQAVVAAHEYGYTQVFANEGTELVNMLQRLQKRAVQPNYVGDIPTGFVKKLYIAVVARSKRTKGLTGGRMPKDLTFTEKQKTVITLLCEGCSRNTIAERMGLKPYTVKSHIELIYRKLDVSNSVDAVLKIQELGILTNK